MIDRSVSGYFFCLSENLSVMKMYVMKILGMTIGILILTFDFDILQGSENILYL